MSRRWLIALCLVAALASSITTVLVVSPRARASLGESVAYTQLLIGTTQVPAATITLANTQPGMYPCAPGCILGVWHAAGLGGTPTLATNTSASGMTSGVSSIIGSDAAGRILWSTGASAVQGNQFTVTFVASYSGTPTVVLSGATASTSSTATSGCSPYVATASSGAFTIGCAVTPASSAGAGTYAVNYWISQ